MHQPEIREVIRPAVTLGLHVVDVDLFPIVQSLVADRTAPVLPPEEVPRTTGRVVGALPPLAPGVLERRVIGGIGGGTSRWRMMVVQANFLRVPCRSLS